jgi:hypothetical protein
MNRTFPSQISAVKHSSEVVRSQSRQRHESLMRDQEREREATAEKTCRLRELRLAKEAADREATAANPPVRAAPKQRKARRSKQT